VTLKYRSLMTITAVGLGLALGWGLGTQQIKAQDAKAPAKVWKGKDNGQEEFGLANAFQNAKGKDKIAALDKWKAAFPDSDYAFEREEFYLGTYQTENMTRQYFDKAVEILKTHPNHFFSIYAVESVLYQLNPATPADLDAGESVSKHVQADLDAIFAPANKPPAINDATWAQTKTAMPPLAQREIGWIAVQRKDFPKAEAELTKYLQMDASQAQFSYFLAQAQFSQRQAHPDKQPPAIFHFTRAAVYDGPNSLDANARKTALTYVTNLYTQYHGDIGGFDKVQAAAKVSAFPPADFTIVSAAQIATQKAQQQAALDAANPILAFWRDIVREPLQKDGDSYFAAMKGALLPGEPGKQKGFEKFKAKLISMDPPNKPKTLVLALEKPDVPDVKLVFDPPLGGTMEPGAELEFEGQPKDFQKEPFMVIFEVDMEQKQLVGWTGKNAPGAGKGKGGPGKGAGKGGTKGKQ
jgi:hypothetical protein